MSTALLQTKLRLPTLPPKRVQRPQLIKRLHEGLESGRKITLVSAPAGFGKTTLIAEWVYALDVPVAWLSLDPSDDDPGRFFAYLIAALQKVDAHIGREIEGVLRAGQLPPGEILSTAIINDIHDFVGRFLLVLDDLQVIQDLFILQVLEKLVAYLPDPLHLVLLTREDPSLPLARLRANNQLTEIRAGDLRFTGPEADRYLHEVMDLSLSETDVATLADRTEGWIVGLQLAGLSVRDREDPSGFIATLSGSHRFILSYLTEEVLGRQPEEIRLFLLQTSVLDRLNGDLCNAVTGRTDGAALLEKLFAANLFLIPLDDEQRWYRYHHLFADLLRGLLCTGQNDTMASLHRRASHWYEQVGLSGEAIRHVLAAADYAAAVRLVESHAMGIIIQGYTKTVESWMQAIPPAWSAQSPRTNLAFAWMYLMRGAYARALPYVERLRAIFADAKTGEEDASLTAEWLALQAMLLNAEGKPAESLALSDRALAAVPEMESHVRSLIHMGRAGAYQMMDDYEHAVEAFQLIILHSRAAADFVPEMLGYAGLVQLAIHHGRLQFAFEIASRGVERVGRSGALSPVIAAVHGALGYVHYQWQQIEQARGYFQRAIQLSTLGGFSDAEISYWVILSRLLQMEGDLEASAAEIQKAVDLMRAVAPAWVREEVVSQQVRVYLAQGRVAAAEAALKGEGFAARNQYAIPALAPGQYLTRPAGLLYNSAIRIILHRARTGHDPAGLHQGIELADRLITVMLQHQYLPVALETLLLRAQMYAVLGQDQAGRADVLRALELAEPEGFIRIFAEEGPPVAESLTFLLERNRLGSVEAGYVKKILAAFTGSQPSEAKQPAPNQAALPSPLTERELDVLRLMAEGLKYEEIAQRLYISLNTVRSHVKAIYGKLEADNRTKAIETGRRLRFL
ncbi:MAG: LuxR C-terminal-related transcriptional regulator [Bacteroidota bacterium]